MILLERYLIPVKFVIFQEFEDFVWKICYPTDLHYFLRILRFCGKDTLSNWYLLYFKNLNILLERYLIPVTFALFNILKIILYRHLPHWHWLFLTIWRFCWKYTLSYWCLLLLKNLKVLLEKYLLSLAFIISQEFENRVGKISYNTEVYYILRIWRFCWKDTLSDWNLLFFEEYEDSIRTIPFPTEIY